MKTRQDFFEEWNQEIQRSGTLTVLHTNAIATHIGISATEFEAIDVIARNQPITAGQLAIFCGLTTGAITGLVDRLEKLQFIRRTKDPNDRRKVLLVTIEDSERSKTVIELYRPLSEGFSDIAALLTNEEIELLTGTQKKLNDMVQRVIERLYEDAKSQ